MTINRPSEGGLTFIKWLIAGSWLKMQMRNRETESILGSSQKGQQ
jgi:hypothetical protein